MRIALFTDGIFPYVLGGIQRHSFYLCKYLAQQKVEIDLYHTLSYGQKEIPLTCFTEEEMKYIHPVFIPFPSNFYFPGHYVYESYLLSKAMYKQFTLRPKVNFVYAKNYTAWYYLKQKQKGANLPPIGVKLHGYEAYQESFKGLKSLHLRNRWNNNRHRRATEFISCNADIVFSYGGDISRIIEMEVGVPKSKIIDIPTGIDETWLLDSERRYGDVRKFVFVGRNTARKGVDLIKQWLLLNESLPYEFHFVGPFDQAEHLPSQKVTYHGAVTETIKLQLILKSCDVLVCPSDSEGMPNVIMEGMSRGLAIIATNVGAVSSMVDDKNGWLIPRRDFNALDNAMKEAITMRSEELSIKGKSSIEKVKKDFLWKNIAEKVIAEIRKF